MYRQPRQATTPFFGPGPITPSPSPTPSLPLTFTPISFTTETLTLASTTLTIPVEVPSSSPPRPSTTVPTPAPTSTGSATDPSFIFLSLDNVTTCGAYTIQWTVSNPKPANLSGAAIDLEVAGIGDNVSFTDTPIASNLPVLSTNYTWNPINVPPGQYQIYGHWSDKHGATVQSQVFNVNSGDTTACLTNTAGTSSAAASPSSHKGAIVGGTVGGVVFLVGIVVAAILLRRLYPSSPSSMKSSSSGGRRRRGWDGLTSQDSKANASRDIGVGSTTDHRHTAAYPGAAESVEDYFSGNKYSNNSASGHMPPLPRYTSYPPGGGAAAASIASLDGLEKVPSPVTPPPPATLEYKAPWAATAAVDAPPPEDVELLRMNSRRSVPESSSPRSSLDISPGSAAGGGGVDLGDPFQAPSSRRSSRTPARKPVPAYTPTQEELESLALARSRSEQSRLRESGGTAAGAGGGTTFLDMATTAHSSSPSPQPPPSPGVPLPPPSQSSPLQRRSSASSTSQLHNKSSGMFDAHQRVHYLMPDPPLPQS